MTSDRQPSAREGSRPLEYEIEVAASPEEVWEAISTGPGISSWFLSVEVEGDEVRFDGVDEPARVTASEPPHRFAYAEESAPDPALDPRTIAYEFLVEARSGGSCVVRLVTSGFGDGEAWDRFRDQMDEGWQVVLRHLRMYLGAFQGEELGAVMVHAPAAGTQDEVWEAFAAALGLAGAREGDRVSTADGAPRLAGTVDVANPRGLSLRLDEPARGFAVVGVYPAAGQTMTTVQLHLFGAGAEEVAARERAAWETWLASSLPSQAAPA